MVNPKLQEYVNTTLAKGYSVQQLREGLLKQGCPASEVNAVLNSVTLVIVEEHKPPKKKSIIIFISIGLVLLFIILFYIFSFPSKSISIGGNTQLTPDITLESICIDDSTGCYKSVALYDNNISLCERVSDAQEKNVCISTIETGKRIYREYTTSNSISFDSHSFVNQCNQTCIHKKMQYRTDTRKSLDDPVLPASVDGQFISKNNKSTSLMSCYCY